MIGLDIVKLLLSIAILYTTLFLIGYVVSKSLKLVSSSEPFFAKFPIVLSVGFIVIIPILFLSGLFVVSSLTIFVLLFISISLILSKLKTDILKNLKQLVTSLHSYNTLVPFLLFMLTSSYFVITIAQTGWPPPGDIMSGSGPLVSLISYNKSLPFSNSPILILYPPGFHLTVATFNQMWGFYPAQSIFIFGAVIAALIPLVVYSLTFLLTNSTLYALLGFSSTFLVYSANLEQWIMGYFYNGAYPCFAGFLILLTFAAILALFRFNIREAMVQNLGGYLMVVFLTFSALLLIYPPFSIFVLLHLSIILVLKRKAIYRQVLGFIKGFNLAKKLLCSLLIILVSASCVLIVFLRQNLNILFGYLTAEYVPGELSRGLGKTSFAYLLSVDYLIGSVSGVLAIIGLPIAIYLIIKKVDIEFSLLYLVLGVPLFLSLVGGLSSFLVVILPKRSLVLVGVLSWPLIFRMMSSLSGIASGTKLRLKFPQSSHKTRFISKKILTVSFSVIFILGSMYPYLSYETNKDWLWFDINSNDFGALEWIYANVAPSDLILNDATFTSEFALSMSVKNLTYCYYSWVVFQDRAQTLLDIWEEPFDPVKLSQFMQEYNISYVLLTSEENQLIWMPDYSYEYISKPYDPQEYANIFDQYQFLEIVYAADSTRVYKANDGI